MWLPRIACSAAVSRGWYSQFVGRTTSLLHPQRTHNHGLSPSCSVAYYSTDYHIAIVGGGPAGFYTAQHILKNNVHSKVDIYERLPVPFGLVRFGVAPDHQDVKNVINTFTQTALNERCSFFGNICIGKDISVEELRQSYDAVVLAYGAEEDRSLSVPGENLKGVVSAREFVGWYNGLPEHQNLDIDLSQVTSVCVLGHGNVALDVARILLTPLDIIQHTDITASAVAQLSHSAVHDVHLVGRRGPLQVAFTTAELREMTKLPGCVPCVDAQQFDICKQHIPALGRPKKRLVELLHKISTVAPTAPDYSGSDKRWHVRFLRSPLAFHDTRGDGTVGAVELAVNQLQGDDISNQWAEATSDIEHLDTQLVVKSIGYKSNNIDATLPFDNKRHILSNTDGRVDSKPGVYCSGWIKRGPVGVIVSTMNDSFHTASLILEDFTNGAIDTTITKPGKHHIIDLLKHKGIPIVDFEGWQRIDREEELRGKKQGKPREKITNITEMLEIAL